MDCALYGNQKRKYGEPNFLFDMLQVSLSHLVLSQSSSALRSIPSSRDNYDLENVYNYNKPFATLLEVTEDDASKVVQPASSEPPNRTSLVPLKRPQYRVNMHALLHIRNFWQRHFVDDPYGIGENTYASMVRCLSASGVAPREWDRSLYERISFNTSWYGHYSCVHPWPKSRQNLEEVQSCAADWDSVDPMMLDLESSTANDDAMFWSSAFSSIPAFSDVMPHPAWNADYNTTYIRGIAPFKNLKSSHFTNDESDEELPKWHPFLASRVNGFVHDVPVENLFDKNARRRRADSYGDDSDRPIPGWKHIVMVVWKPTIQHLLAVLEFAEEEYGGAAGIQISAEFNTADIWNDATASLDGPNNLAIDASTSQATDGPSTNGDDNIDALGDDDASAQPTEAQIEAQMKILLAQRIKSLTKSYTALQKSETGRTPPGFGTTNNSPAGPKSDGSLPPLFSARHIRELEESFSQAQYLAWDDGTIDYAYAYEGLIIPGGKIMMGRWWRIHGLEGLGPGREVGPDAVGIELRRVDPEPDPGPGPEANLPNPDTDADYDSSDNHGGAGSSSKRKRDPKSTGTPQTRRKTAAPPPPRRLRQRQRRLRQRGTKRKAATLDSDSDFIDSDADVDAERDASKEEAAQVKYEFVTLVNGQESRVGNGSAGKPLERGPFVFWAA